MKDEVKRQRDEALRLAVEVIRLADLGVDLAKVLAPVGPDDVWAPPYAVKRQRDELYQARQELEELQRRVTQWDKI